MAFPPGFDVSEAEQLIAICTYLNMYPKSPQITPQPPPVTRVPVPGPLPADWQLDKPVTIPLDENAFQIGHNAKTRQYVLAFRGTVNKVGSILEDADILTVSAEGYARRPDARLHQGFKLGFESMVELIKLELDKKFDRLENGETMDLFVTGHSQGAAIAALCGNWLKYTSWDKAPRINSKSYTFAQPKPGNDYFAYDYDLLHTFEGMSFRITNDLDIVPQVPLTIQLPGDLNPRYKDLFNAFRVPKFLEKVLEIKLPCTLNYAPVGSPIMLEGIADPDAFPKDFFFQHHAGRYWQLILDGRYQRKES